MNISFMQELESARSELRKAKRGNGPVPQSCGQVLYEGAIVLLSARLQAHIDELFRKYLKIKFLHIRTDLEVDKFMKHVGNWGNPNYQNVNNLFLRLGIFDLLSDYSYQGSSTEDMKKDLERLNQVRNKIAHGRNVTEVKGFSFANNIVWGLATFVTRFGDGLDAHIANKIQ